MKLIRVSSSTDDLTGYFANEWSESIVIPPHSQIAVLNGTFGMSTKNINIPACTITFSVKANNGHEYTANIPAGLYSQSDFVTIISENLNTSYYDDSVYDDGLPDALAFKISLSSDNKLSVNFAKSSKSDVGGIAKWTNAKNMDEAKQDDGDGERSQTKGNKH